MVQFLAVMGAGISLVSWCPRLCGYMLFPAAVAVVTVTAVLAEKAVMDVSQQCNSKSFAELCSSLPQWMIRVTELSNIVYFLLFVSMYIQMLQVALRDQFFGWAGELQLYVFVALCVFVATLPTNFSGPLARLLNVLNFVTTWLVVSCAFAKGSMLAVVSDNDLQDQVQLTAWRPEGFFKALIVLEGVMCCVGTMPQLNSELREKDRSRAALQVPLASALLQAISFLLVGLAGYFALGDRIEGDAFSLYAALHPDSLVTIMQIGLAVLIYLSTPICMLPAKQQAWTYMKSAFSLPHDSIESAPGWKLGLNAVLVSLCMLLGYVLGEDYLRTLYLFTCGTAGCWLNLCLPAFLLFFTQIVPGFKAGGNWMLPSLVCAWLLLLAVVSAISAVFDAASLLQEAPVL